MSSSYFIFCRKKSWFCCYLCSINSFIHPCLLRHNGSKIEQCSWIYTHTQMQPLKEQKRTKLKTSDITLLCWWMCLIQPALLFVVWRESTTNHTDIQLQQIFVIPDVTEKIIHNYQKWTTCSKTEVFVHESSNLYAKLYRNTVEA